MTDDAIEKQFKQRITKNEITTFLIKKITCL